MLYLPGAQPSNATQQFSELRTERLLQGRTAEGFHVHDSWYVHDNVNVAHFVNTGQLWAATLSANGGQPTTDFTQSHRRKYHEASSQ
jgi:recombinational DNA repair ATPase RecF